jgi:RimJ/RimL family protein N-acetyltransferase
MNVIETERLLLRTWEARDAQAFYHINQDPKVIEYLLGPLSLQEINDFFVEKNQQFAAHHYTLFAAVEKRTEQLIGFIGLNSPTWTAHFTPCVEIGWRLGSQYWHQGYATEGAKAVLAYGFTHCGLDEIVAFTVPQNLRSIRVMEKLGMQRDSNDDFCHPKLPRDHLLSQHVLYRIKKSASS